MQIRTTQRQINDKDNQPITNSNTPKLITSSTTTSMFTGVGVFLGMNIWKDVDGGTMYFTDNDDAAITGLPHSTAKAVLDYAGQFSVPRLELTNGLKIVTENATGLAMTAYANV